MPKFHCIHCGQHIDAPDQMAGSQSACPTCGGEIAVPRVPEIQPIAPLTLPSSPPNLTKPTGEHATKTKNKIGSIVASGLFMLVTIVIARSCGNFVAQKQLGTAPAAQKMTLAGLSLNLSGTPQKAEFGMGEAAPNIISQDGYVLQNDSTQFGVTRTIHRSMDGSLDDNARGVVEGQEKYSIVDGFVDGLAAKRITVSVDMGGNVQHISMILFAKGNSLWQVASVDPNPTIAHGKLDKLIPTIKVTE
jgi:hypothetical protein